MKKVMLAVAVALLAASAAQAHYLWAVWEGDAWRIARGMPPDRYDPYRPQAVKEIRAFDRQGRAVAVERLDGKDRVRFRTAAPPALVTVFCEWGHRVNTPEGKKFLSKKAALAQGLTVEEAFSSSHFSKTIFAFGEAQTRPLGLLFELVPLKDPFTLSPGEALPVQVLFDGAPLAGCRVMAAKVTDLLETDPQGKVQVPLPEKGLQMLYASHRVPSPDRTEIDYMMYMTFLSFTRP